MSLFCTLLGDVRLRLFSGMFLPAVALISKSFLVFRMVTFSGTLFLFHEYTLLSF